MNQIVKLFIFFQLSLISQLNATQVFTLAKWDNFSNEEKSEYIQGHSDKGQFSNLKTLEFNFALNQDPSTIVEPSTNNFMLKVRATVENSISLEVEDSYYPHIGETYISNFVVLLLDDKILGGAISFTQLGCVMDDSKADEDFFYFESELEAITAGCDVNADVSWQAHAVLNHDLSILEISDYMEWSGH